MDKKYTGIVSKINTSKQWKSRSSKKKMENGKPNNTKRINWFNLVHQSLVTWKTADWTKLCSIIIKPEYSKDACNNKIY